MKINNKLTTITEPEPADYRAACCNRLNELFAEYYAEDTFELFRLRNADIIITPHSNEKATQFLGFLALILGTKFSIWLYTDEVSIHYDANNWHSLFLKLRAIGSLSNIQITIERV